MACSEEFIRYLCRQLEGAGDIAARKMFGEYGVYCDGKIFALICDDQLFVKITKAGRKRYPHLPEAPPYEGGKNYFFIEDVDNREMLTELTMVTCEELPKPKPKKKKG